VTIETRPAETPVPTKTVADVLRHAARIIEERGWYQGYYSWGLDRNEPDSGPVCALGAIGVAYGGSAGAIDDFPFDDPVVGLAHRFMGGEAAYWNDAQGRTAAEVTAALRSAADAWEAEQ
jgi:hypothetical protein